MLAHEKLNPRLRELQREHSARMLRRRQFCFEGWSPAGLIFVTDAVTVDLDDREDGAHLVISFGAGGAQRVTRSETVKVREGSKVRLTVEGTVVGSVTGDRVWVDVLNKQVIRLVSDMEVIGPRWWPPRPGDALKRKSDGAVYVIRQGRGPGDFLIAESSMSAIQPWTISTDKMDPSEWDLLRGEARDETTGEI